MGSKRIFLIVLCFAVMAGCSGIRKITIKASEQEVKNAQTARDIAANYLGIWPIQSGFVRGALGPNLTALPANAVAAMDELDELAAKTSWDDTELGTSLGLRVRMLNSIVIEALKMYAPDVFSVIGFLAQ